MDYQEQTAAYFRAIGAASAEDFVPLFTEDVHFEDPVGGRVLQGHDGVAAFHKGLRRAWSSIDMTADSVFVRDKRAAARWSASGQSVTGKDINFAGINVFHFDADGRIARLEGYWDFEAVIGMM